jgi:predicted CXXCH cytochrome family protein
VKLLFLATIFIIMLALVSGCVTKENYKNLSFFFDGVPNPSVVKKGYKPRKGEVTASDSEKQATQHGPYVAKLCEACHNRGNNTLVRPIEQLCANCHDIQLNKKWIHGPLASGGCRVCHLPHTSPYRFLLVSDSRDFCFHCHSKSDVARNPAHEGVDSGCISCHEPHMSDNMYLLR